MGKSLYRRYRSESFDEIIGQDHIIRTLSNSLKNGQIAHAYLLNGPRGVGKTSIARIFAYKVNNIDYQSEATNLDIIEIDAASNRRIDEIREIRDKINIAPSSHKYKVYIIDEVHMLTREAFNALLKTLEEPPEYVIFILATTELHKVPETIISRCINFTFKPIDPATIKDHLKNIAKKEKIVITDDALDIIAKHGRGSFRDAISSLEQVKYTSDNIDADDVYLMLGLVPSETIDKIVSAIESLDIKNLTSEYENAINNGANESILASQISENFRNILVSNTSGNLSKDSILSCLKNLLLVAGSNNPNLALEICLHQLIYDNLDKSEDKLLKTVVTPKKTESKNIVNQKIENTKPSDFVPTDNLWLNILQNLKAENNTLYGIARMADVDINDETIKLTFKFKFHLKQISEPKNSQIITKIADRVSDRPIKLDFGLVDNTQQVDSEISNISNIFGEAEVLES